MDNKELTNKIEGAKDDLGVVTQSAFQNQLASLSPQDWQQAANIYSKDAPNSNGFYIDDSSSGQITIHNDMTQAKAAAAGSVIGDTINDAKKLGLDLAAGGATAAGMVGLSGATLAFGVEGAALSTSAAFGASCAATIAVPMAAGLAVVGAGVLGVEAGQNIRRHAEALPDLQLSAEVGTGRVPAPVSAAK